MRGGGASLDEIANSGTVAIDEDSAIGCANKLTADACVVVPASGAASIPSGIVAEAERDVCVGEGEAIAPDPEVAAAAQRLHGRWGYRFVKRAFDIAFSLVIMVLFSWLFAVIAIAIKVEDPKGPVIFKQRRVTKDGREFTMYKFRSMCVDAEAKLDDLRKANEKTGPVFKMANDPRVTKVGRVIRKVSIDELPQFVNVLKGDLSVVGPRPALPSEVLKYTPRQRQRLLAKAGITCYWQTRKNRDAITFDEWVDLDLMYIKQCSVWADFKLVIQTIGVVLTAQGS